MTDAPQDDTWWLATDGKWYPPSSHPSAWEKDGLEAPNGLPSTPNTPEAERRRGVSDQSPTASQSHLPPHGTEHRGTASSRAVSRPSESRWARWRPCSVLTTLAVSTGSIGFVLAAFGVVAGVIAVVQTDQFARSIKEPGESARISALRRLRDTETLVRELENLGTILWIALSLLLFFWLYNAYKSVELSGATGRTWSKGWAVGGFFIPLANLAIPFLVASEIFNISSAIDNRQPLMNWKSAPDMKILVWWAGFIGWIVFRFLATAQTQPPALIAAGSDTDLLALARNDFIFTTGALTCSALAFGALVLVLSQVRANLRSADLD